MEPLFFHWDPPSGQYPDSHFLSFEFHLFSPPVFFRMEPPGGFSNTFGWYFYDSLPSSLGPSFRGASSWNFSLGWGRVFRRLVGVEYFGSGSHLVAAYSSFPR